MAKILENGKWKKRTLTALSLALATTFSLGVFSACATKPDEQEETESKVAPPDTQVIKNGDFEFYSDKLVDDDDNGKPLAKYNIISSPDNWTFTSGTSNTKSGVIDVADWDYFTKTGGYAFKTFTKGEGDDAKEVTTFESIAEAYENWENADVSAYDRLKFLDLFSTEISALDKNSDEAKLFAKYSYSVDFEDVEKFIDEKDGVEKLGTSGNVFELHEGATDGEENKEKTSVLMIHNRRTADDGVRGTAQYYTSGTTVTLSAGTAAEVSVWVRTDALYHYKDTKLTRRGGAYIGVTNTVGGSTLDQMQVYNIHTDGEWQKYTFYVRASTFATSTFRIVLGLGQGSSDDKYYAVDGYAFFDDVQCKIVAGTEYDSAVHTENGGVREGIKECTVDSLKEEKQFDYDTVNGVKSYALDLYSGFEADADLLKDVAAPALTEEKSGSNLYTSEKIDASRNDDKTQNVAEVTTFGAIRGNTNRYLQKVFANDFENKFPFGGDDTPVVMLLSANGAAYTAKLGDITLEKGERKLISFFAKTSKIQSGLTGASATLIDGENKTVISSFDTTTLATVDIDSKSDDENLKDIYKGWTQCFFFVENDTDEQKTFHIELSYGPTTIVGTDKFSYGEGYAAFTNFEVKSLTKTEYGYASTGDRAKKVSLVGKVTETKKFDSVSATAEKDIESGPALPVNYRGVVGGSNVIQAEGVQNIKPANVYAGLLDSEYVDNYYASAEEWKTLLDPAANGAADADEWWTSLFGSSRQPLVIVNGEEAAYGYYSETQTVSASSYRRISMRVKVSEGAKANIYLLDTTAEKAGTMLSPNLPKYTFWYDDEGNIVNMDPQSDAYEKEGKILYALQPNGLYLNAQNPEDPKYYANLSSYNGKEDEEGNLLTKDGTIAFYKENGIYYGRRVEGEIDRSLVVVDLPTTEGVRYDFSDRTLLPQSQIEIEGTGEWTTVNFYIHTGNTQKSYRLEVWSGSRDGKTKNPEGSYVFFDNYSSSDASSNFTTIRDEAVQAIKDKLNADKKLGAEDYLGTKDNLPEEYAGYYTFTFYDSDSYLRYDETVDSEGLGNPYYSYTQSSYEEQLVWLSYSEEATAGMDADRSFFLDYSANEVTVEREYPPTEDNTTDDDHTHESDTEEPMNIWLLIASGSLAIVLLFAIGAVIVRRIWKNRSKRTKIKAGKDKRYRPVKTDSSESGADES